MFAGHVGAALAIGRVERRVNVGTFVFAALLLSMTTELRSTGYAGDYLRVVQQPVTADGATRRR
jgi:hypothetical protein